MEIVGLKTLGALVALLFVFFTLYYSVIRQEVKYLKRKDLERDQD